jgi:membrane-anchored glycerophosphoryl diester phosphodiesterase (GDPDase)
MYIYPLIINILLIVFVCTNLKTPYNIYYIGWIVLSLFPIINIATIIIFPWIIYDQLKNCQRGDFKMKSTKLNKFLFGYEDKRKN